MIYTNDADTAKAVQAERDQEDLDEETRAIERELKLEQYDEIKAEQDERSEERMEEYFHPAEGIEW